MCDIAEKKNKRGNNGTYFGRNKGKLDNADERNIRIEGKLDYLKKELIEIKNENQGIKIENKQLRVDLKAQEERIIELEREIRKKKIVIFEKRLQDDVILSYITHLDPLHKDFTKRFDDLLNLQIPQWTINPYNITAMEETNMLMQEPVITISTDEELKQKFNQGYQKIWLQHNIETQYPVL
ncbi:unnamed protein product [Psylliodes chrysocephalus]|uniref:Uncharacterized protein n=1 Tax=Psylliodes chrysocephalus TaxID=3402493 RepID=A0A9P0GHD9_9CUCU|nr:unnamed protein product [Psylliodes chrysocephala]